MFSGKDFVETEFLFIDFQLHYSNLLSAFRYSMKLNKLQLKMKNSYGTIKCLLFNLILLAFPDGSV